jgi:uncharacterized protein YegL
MPESIGAITDMKAFEQLGILVLDGSGSMAEIGGTSQSKANEVNLAVRSLVARLKASRNRDNFYLGIITFDTTVNEKRVPPTAITQMDEFGDYDPLNGHGGGTHIGDALEKAADVARSFLSSQQRFPRSAVIVVMSDGHNTGGADPVTVANAIKQSGQGITICCAAYGKGDDIDEQSLQRMVTNPSGYIHAYDTEQLRKFFEASISARRASPTVG